MSILAQVPSTSRRLLTPSSAAARVGVTLAFVAALASVSSCSSVRPAGGCGGSAAISLVTGGNAYSLASCAGAANPVGLSPVTMRTGQSAQISIFGAQRAGTSLTSSAPALVTVKGFVLQANTVGRAVIGANHLPGGCVGTIGHSCPVATIIVAP
jgi:hypothetical protein